MIIVTDGPIDGAKTLIVGMMLIGARAQKGQHHGCAPVMNSQMQGSAPFAAVDIGAAVNERRYGGERAQQDSPVQKRLAHRVSEIDFKLAIVNLLQKVAKRVRLHSL